MRRCPVSMPGGRLASGVCQPSQLSSPATRADNLPKKRSNRLDRGLAMRGFAARKGAKNAIDQRASGFRAQLDRDTVTAALALIGEVDGEHMVERRMIRWSK